MNEYKMASLNARNKAFPFIVNGKIYEVDIIYKFYLNGRTAIALVDEFGERVATATVNLLDAELPNDDEHDYVLIKTWSENENMLDFLIKNGIVEDMGIDVPTGFVKARLVKLI